MNRYFKIIQDNYIIAIGNDDFNGETITEEEYNYLKSIIDNKSPETGTHYYKLRADTLEYEAIERAEQIILPQEEPRFTLDEAAALIAEEAASYE